MYPTLSERLQKEWDEAEQARYDGYITEQVKKWNDHLQADEMSRHTFHGDLNSDVLS